MKFSQRLEKTNAAVSNDEIIIQDSADLFRTKRQKTSNFFKWILESARTFVAQVTFNSIPILGSALDPTDPNHLARKGYVDGLLDGLKWKNACRMATTANITLSGLQTIDTISGVADDRVLVKNQTTQSQNGIYLMKSGAWVRATDADIAVELEYIAVLVKEGSQANTIWTQNTKPITLGVSNIVFSQVSGGAVWGGITGTLSSQADLQSALNGKMANGATAATIAAWAGKFDKDYVVAEASPETANIGAFNFVDAVVGATVTIFHNHSTAPTEGTGATTIHNLGGSYILSTLNIITYVYLGSSKLIKFINQVSPRGDYTKYIMQTSDAAHTNTLTASSMFNDTSGRGTRTFSANEMLADGVIEVQMEGSITRTAGTDRDYVVAVKWGATTMGTFTLTRTADHTNRRFVIRFRIFFDSVGASVTPLVIGESIVGENPGGFLGDPIYNQIDFTSAAINTTTSNAFDLEGDWNEANAGLSITAKRATIRVLNVA